MNTIKLGPQISNLLKNPEDTLGSWQEHFSEIQSRHGNLALVRPGSPQAEAAFADILPLRFVANAYLAKKTMDIFVRDYSPDASLPVPSPYSFRASMAPDDHPYATTELSIRHAMWQSAKNVRRSHQYDFEPKILKFADRLNAADFWLRGGGGAGGWKFENSTVWRGGGTGTRTIAAFFGAIPALLEAHSGARPTNEQIYETAQASHRAPMMLAAANIPTVAFLGNMRLSGDTSTLEPETKRPLVVARREGQMPCIEFTGEMAQELAKARDWDTPRGTPVQHMGCLALARLPDLMSNWRKEPNLPRTNAIDQQITWMAAYWRDHDLWERPTIDSLRSQSVAWHEKAVYKPLPLVALHGMRSQYARLGAAVVTAKRV